MQKKETPKYVIVRERTLQSALQDLTTFGIITLAFWFNYKFINGNDALDVLLMICFFLFAFGRAAAYRSKLDIKVTEDK